MVQKSRSGHDAVMSDDDERWYYCLRHKTVEQGQVCPNSDRLGPYETREEAEGAIAKAAERTEAWDHDPRWADDE
jgi:hypothetical protein